MALDNVMPHMLGDYGSWVANDGNNVVVSNPSEMIPIVAPMIKVNGHVLEPQNVDEKLDLQCGEAQC